MSRQAIAAALARDDLVAGERLVAFSLASFADRDGRARPGTLAATARAGLKRSWFLESREALVRRGLLVVEVAATGRGRASTLWLRFSDEGPWWEGEINAELFETVLSYSRARGSARLLLAAMAALADDQRVIDGVTTARLCEAAGVTDRTYRRARAALLASGEVVLRGGTGGRGNTNRWEVTDPRSRAGAGEPVGRRRVAPPPGQPPLLATVSATPGPAAEQPGSAAAHEFARDSKCSLGLDENGGADRTVPGENCPGLAGVSAGKGGAERTLLGGNSPAGAGVSVVKGGAERTLAPETPARTPAETPAPNARAGREPQNPRTVHPPSPPQGGTSGDSIVVEETYVTERGRKRRRAVRVELADVRCRLGLPAPADQDDWRRIRETLLEAVGASTFALWLEPLELIAVDRTGALVVAPPAQTESWVRARFGRIMAGRAERVGRELRIAGPAERAAVQALAGHSAGRSPTAPDGASASPRADWSSDQSSYTSAYERSYTHVYSRPKEVA